MDRIGLVERGENAQDRENVQHDMLDSEAVAHAMDRYQENGAWNPCGDWTVTEIREDAKAFPRSPGRTNRQCEHSECRDEKGGDGDVRFDESKCDVHTEDGEHMYANDEKEPIDVCVHELFLPKLIIASIAEKA